MKIKKVREIILTVNDMQKQVDFYQDVLGLKINNPVKDGNYKNEMLATFDTGFCTFRLHANMANSSFDDSSKYLVTFEVDDIQKSVDELSKKGIDMSEIKENTPGKFTSHFTDPEDNLIRIGSFLQS